MRPAVRWGLLSLTLIGLGLLISGHLLARTFALLADRPDAIDVCSTVFGASCDKVLLAPTSWQLGIPLAGWGLVYYGTLASLLVLARVLGEAFESKATLGTLLMAGVGASVSLLLVASVVVRAVPLCPLCIAVHTINLALVPVLWLLTARTARQLLEAVRAGGRYMLGGQTDPPSEAHWKVAGFLIPALVAIVLYQWVLVQSERRVIPTQSGFDPKGALAAYASTPEQDITLRVDDPRLGPADALVRLVVFSSFQCPGCQIFAHEIRHLVERFPDRLSIIFKHYPLGMACNPAVSVDRHSRSCQAAWAVEAAHRQGKFWPFHDGLFASDLQASESTIYRIAREVGLEMTRFETDRGAQETRAKIKSDIELGVRLGVNVTPSVFVNGRRVQHISGRALQVLIRQELESAGP